MRPCASIVAGLALSGLAASQPGQAAEDVDRFQAGQSGLVAFPTRDVDGFHDLYHGENRYNARSMGTLVLPAEIDRPVPAMVILHGSGGEWSGRGIRHAAFLAEHGIAAFVVDTFEGRGLGRDVRYAERLRHVNVPDQIADALAALDVLSSHPNIDAGRIGVMGYSMGGASALVTAYEEIAGIAGPTSNRFALHVPFYAPCFVSHSDNATTGAPIVAIWGDRDESTHQDACTALADELSDGGSAVATHWLEGAAHGWNNLNPMTFYPSLPHASPCLFVIGADGDVVERITGNAVRTDEQVVDTLASCTDRGYIIGHHPEAHAEANRILLQAIEAHLMP